MGSRKKRQEKRKDFVKPKLRVGKTQANAANFTSTSFKSKSIQLRQQITTNLSTDDEFRKQLSLLKHHSSTSRKEVITQLTTEITNLTSASNFPYDELMTKFKPLVLDSSQKVRESSILLLKQISTTQPSILMLHQNSLVLFILSAMTHIDQSIRNDSIKFLEVLISAPSFDLSEAIIRANWAKILRNFMQLMNWTVEDGNKSGSKSVSFSVTTGTAALNSAKSAKRQKERKLIQIKLLANFIMLGCLYEKRKEAEKQASFVDEEGKNNSDKYGGVIQIHAFTKAYMIQSKANPFGNLKLFNAIEIPNHSQAQIKSNTKDSKTFLGNGSANPLIDVDGLTSEDITNRRKILIEIFYPGLVLGLTDLLNDENPDLKKVSQTLLNDLEEIKNDYELDSQK
ncbi:hypothetical protein CANARDRAFT_27748 [[Candida] arabinofermentans NRRL YB-2248]|uniref:Pre-rRNA-processing protein n=1 Tax=[Candida] arabinofermentans NRRL YB-2248 TaxID=983967 RepID=A0A1E4T487_9ASCO|nr:hypothetical protein CANARDRAFT_27748 [[Candida] arabinofermentans NRRL YB-2248]